MSELEAKGPVRRDFLKTGAALAGGALLFGDWTPAQAAALATRRMGRTEIKCTILSFGAIQLTAQNRGSAILERAIQQGVNLVHVAPGYTGGQALAQVGQAMKRYRKNVFIALKCEPDEAAVDAALRTLGTSFADILIPNVGGRSLADGNLRKRFESLQKKKKIGAIGFATHSGMASDIKTATGAGWWDCVLTAYNPGCSGELSPLMASAVRSQDMGFMAMKVAQHRQGDFGHHLRTLLQNKNVATVTPGMGSMQQVDENIAAVAGRVSELPQHEGPQYAASCAGKVCSMCGKCEKACPRGVAVGEYLRAFNYRERGDIALANQRVAASPQRRSLAVCNRCAVCDHNCGNQVSVMDRIHSVA